MTNRVRIVLKNKWTNWRADLRRGAIAYTPLRAPYYIILHGGQGDPNTYLSVPGFRKRRIRRRSDLSKEERASSNPGSHTASAFCPCLLCVEREADCCAMVNLLRLMSQAPSTPMRGRSIRGSAKIL